jgi:phosphoglycolate phosphatase
MHRSSRNIVVFDLDGTLVDSGQVIARATNWARTNLGLIPATEELLVEWFGMHPSSFFPEIKSPDQLDSAVQSFRRRLELEHGLGIHAFADVEDCLNQLARGGWELAVATTKPTYLALDVLKKTHLLKYFAHVQGTDEFRPKPAPDVFQRVLSALKVEKESILVSVGDRTEDTIAAKLSGLIPIGLSREPSGISEEEHIMAGAKLAIKDLYSLSERLEFYLEEIQ